MCQAKVNPFVQAPSYSSFCEDVMHLGQTRAVMLADQAGASGAQIAAWIAKFSGKRPLNSDPAEPTPIRTPFVPFTCG